MSAKDTSKKPKKINSTMRINEFGIVEFVMDDGYSLHRDHDQPAKIDPCGVFSYWYNGKLHRKNGPAVVNHDGSKSYFHHGEWLMTVRADGQIFVNDKRNDMVSIGN